MERLRKAIEYLDGDQNVADFQKFCGVEFLPTPRSNGCLAETTVCNGNGVVESGEKDDTGILNNDKTNQTIHRNRYYSKVQNGLSQNGNLVNGIATSLTEGKNGFVKNGLVHRCHKDGVHNDTRESHVDHKQNDSVQREYKITYKFLHFMFHFGASLGNEVFYIIFFPLVMWNLDSLLLRQTAIVWHAGMYIGQAAKDVIRRPRPSSPPAIHLEKRYAEEYGMPSTHASVGAIIPFGLLILSMNRYQYDFSTGLTIALFWTILVGLSRIYLGMHSALDVICGLIVACIIMPCSLPFVGVMDKLQVTHPYAPVITVLGSFLVCFVYPPIDKWNSARSDTATVHGIGSGIAFGAWLNHYSGYYHAATTDTPFPIHWPSVEWITYSVLRIAVGCAVLVVFRLIVKYSLINGLCKLYGLDKNNVEHLRQKRMEVPQKFFTYWTISVMAVYHIPLLFCYLGIVRESFYTEF